MANFFFSFVRPRSLCFYSFTAPNPRPKPKPKLNLGSLPFKPRPNFGISFSSSRGEELDIVSTSECADGSVVFRFGDASEIEEERVGVAAAGLVDEGVKEIEVIDEGIDRVTDEIVNSSSLVRESLGLVEESVSGSEAAEEGESGGEIKLSEALLSGNVDLEGGFVDKNSGSGGSDEVGGDIECGFELSETLLDEGSVIEEGFVDEVSVSGGDGGEVEGKIGGGLEMSETLLDNSSDVEKGLLVKDGVNCGGVEGKIGGGLELNETLLENSLDIEKGLLDKDGVNCCDEVEGETGGRLELSEPLMNDGVGLEKGIVDKGSVNHSDEVEGETVHGLELSEAMSNDGSGLETGFVDKGSVNHSDEGEGETVRGLELTETLLEEIVDVEEGSIRGVAVGGGDVVEEEIDGALELSETFFEVSVDMEEGYIESSGSENDVVEGETIHDHELELSETLLEAKADTEEALASVKKGSVSGNNMMEGESDCALEVSVDKGEGYIENIGRGSDVVEGESDGVLELTGTALENSLKLEDVSVENNSSSPVEVADLDYVVKEETGDVLNKNCEGNAEDNGVSTSILGMVNQEVKADKLVAELPSLELHATADVHHSYKSAGRSEENDNVEVSHHSGISVNINMDTEMNNVSGENMDTSNLIEVLPISAALEAEPILEEETSHETVDESVEIERGHMMVSEMLDVSTLSSDEVETITEDDAQSTNISGESVHEPLELQPTSLTMNENSAKRFSLSSGAALFPVASKALTGREDAYFVASQDWLGVADGVSEWSLEGINVGSYAQELMENCKKIVLDSKSVSITNPVEVLSRSVSETESLGSSTALVAFFDGRVLHVANIGDSGFMIVRNDTIFKRSSPMVHGFNFPVHIDRGDDPSKLVEEYEIELGEDDIIVVATDGLFDNLYEQEIASIVSTSIQAGLEPQETAELLAARALEVASSAASTRSPFADDARAAGYVGYSGGKLDDVAVIVSLVQKRSSDPDLKQV